LVCNLLVLETDLLVFFGLVGIWRARFFFHGECKGAPNVYAGRV
jgi:hypothetical protein